MSLTPQQERRDHRATSADDRSRATRRRLASALTAALDAGEPAGVASVCARAEVGRSTFYTHFATLDELVEFAIDDLFTDLAPIDRARRESHSLSRTEITRIGLAELIGSVLGSRAILAYASRQPGREQLRNRLIVDMSRSLRGTILAERADASESFISIASEYVAGGVISVLLRLVENPEDYDHDEVVAIIADILPVWLTSEHTASSDSR
ncbi:hypothetical protein GCM10027416_14450 [Okibacterium endophyticum]